MFASERLAEHELESVAVTRRYLGFIERLVTLRDEEKAASRARWIHRVEPDYANIIHGLELALAHRRIDLAFEIGELAAYYWVQTGEWSEGMGWLDRLLAARPASGLNPSAEVRVLSQAGLLPTLLRMSEKAAPILAEALAQGKALGEPGPLALAHETNGIAAWQLGDLESAQAHFERAYALFEEAGDRGALAINAGNLGVLEATRGRYEAACERYRQSQRLCAELGDQLAAGKALINLGWACIQLQRFDEAEAALREALDLHESYKELPAVVMAHHNLGELFIATGDFASARRHMHEARQLRARMGDRGGLAASLPHFYMLLEREGRLETAAVILIGLLDLLERRGVPARPESRRRFYDWKETLAERLGAETMVRCETTAAALDLDGLLDLDESTTPRSGG
jgi:tetratricopeptide (TPR) repeat protein